LRPWRGDIDGNGHIDLKDAVRVLTRLSRRVDEGNFRLAADVDGDGRIGIAEAVFALQHATRPY
jgi:hypothetical protein